MANIKFSAFDATDPVSATIDLVAAKSGNNIRFTPADLAPFTGIYAANGTIGTTRKALITDTIQFRNAGDTSDIFTLNTDGTFTLGLGASTSTASGIAIGANASSTAASGIAIGAMTSHVTTAGLHSIAMGGSTRAAGTYSVAIGYNCGDNSTSTNSCVNIGNSAQGDGANSITLSATDAGDVGPSTAKAFGVYMSNKTTPDFQIAHDGNSFITGTGNFGIGTSSPLYTLDTKGSVAGNWLARVENDSGTGFGLQVKVNSTDSTKRTFSTRNANGYTMSVYNDGVVEINGQAYTELHTNATNLVVNWNDGNVQAVTISGSAPTFAPTNPKAGATYILTLTQGATPVTVDFNSLVKWSGGAPTLSSTTGQIDVITLICYNDSGSGLYYGAASLNLA